MFANYSQFVIVNSIMNPEQVHQNQASSGSGHFEQDSEIQRSAMPPSQLFADPDPPVQRQEGEMK